MSDSRSSRVVSGFLTGLGFSIAFVLIVSASIYAYSTYLNSQSDATGIVSMPEWKVFDESAGLTIESHRSVQAEDALDIVGVIANRGADTWESISIEVELFDDEDNYLDECTDYIRGALKPGERENFTVRCGGCEGSLPGSYERYEIAVKDANFQMQQDSG